MQVVVRTDASSVLGHGHVARCLSLAAGLRTRGAVVTFLSCEHLGHLCDLIEARGFSVQRLSPTAGASWEDDARTARQALEASRLTPDWLIVDHYALDYRYEAALRPAVRRILAIDDTAVRSHDCDLLLDQNLVADAQTRYNGKVPETCALLLGPRYALLHSAYADLHDRLPPREGPVRRVLVSFGGADADNLTGRVAAIFRDRPAVDVDIVSTAANPHVESLSRQVEGLPHLHLHLDQPTLAPLMARADLAIGAGGATSWERLCLGLPSLVVTLAENQRPIAEELSRQGLIQWFGDRHSVDWSALVSAVDRLVREGLDGNVSRRCRAIVDGRGADRISAALTASASTPLRARHATLADEALLLEWANDPTTRRKSFSSSTIDLPTHRGWFHARLRDVDGCHLFVVETDESQPVGQVRFQRQQEAWEVHFALAPAFRGRGLGRSLLDAAFASFVPLSGGGLILGRVKPTNRPSRALFEALGFEGRLESDVVVYRRDFERVTPGARHR